MRSTISDSDYQEFKRGIEEFNEARYFDCHETLESVWKRHLAEDRELIQGIIQVAVAYYHLERANSLGAKKLFTRAKPRLEKFRPNHMNVDVQHIYECAMQALQKLDAGAPSDQCLPGPKIHLAEP